MCAINSISNPNPIYSHSQSRDSIIFNSVGADILANLEYKFVEGYIFTFLTKCNMTSTICVSYIF
jgi:hypothetical protein